MALVRLIDAIALLLLIAPLANGYFLWVGMQRYRRDSEHSPILLALLSVLFVVWSIGLFVAALSGAYLLRPQPAEATLAGVGFGIGLLLLQALPHFIEHQMKRIEADHHDEGA